MSNVRPMRDRIAVKVLSESVTKGGIILTEGAKEKPQTGEVIAIGTERYFGGTVAPLQVKVGDKVLFGKYSGAPVPKENEDDPQVLIMREDDVLAVIN